jgi:diaminohydroxyphosphoribosylaminopyrimidine deaminase/5-amino-6-(5-phosphoribosylamino)uracil reductase
MQPRHTPQDEAFLRKALELAERGRGFVSPNPMVGAIVVREGEIVGTGFHRRFGGDHAEVEALRDAGDQARDATLYVNLEPCSHFGKTPPCVNRIIDAGVKRVIVGAMDPNPLVNGRGIAILREHGIEVEAGVLEESCRDLNAAFLKFITTGLPYVTLKLAQSLDGKIADARGASRWISNSQARRLVHRWRWQHDAILIGIGTVLKDNPMLTVRDDDGPQPRRIILDSFLRTPLNAHVVSDAYVHATIIVISETCNEEEKIEEISKRGGVVWKVPADPRGGVVLNAVMARARLANIAEIMVEGGRSVFSSFLEGRLADRLACFIAPMLLGDGVPAFHGIKNLAVDKNIFLQKTSWQVIDDNVLLTGNLHYPLNQLNPITTKQQTD